MAAKQVRPGVWQLRVRNGTLDPKTGRYRQFSKTVQAKNATEAKKALRAFENQIDAGVDAVDSGTVDELIEEWLRVASASLSPSTVYGYRAYVKRYVSPAFGWKALTDLSAQDLDMLYLSMTGKGLKSATVRQVHAIVRRALGQAVKWDLVPANVALKATPPRLVSDEIHPPTLDEVRKLLLAAEETDTDMMLAVRLAAVAGPRRGELCALRWSDLSGTTMVVARSVVGLGGRTFEKDTKTHGVRRVTLDAATVELIEAHRERMARRNRYAPEGFVFTETAAVHDTPFHPDSMTKRFSRIAARADVNCRFHDLRHFHASQLVADGVDVRTVAGRLGHRNASVTLGVYSHFLPAADADAADRGARGLD